jgi:hypothetical protein
MSSENELPEVLPSAADDEYECVLVDPEAARAPSADEPSEGLCPPGYVPRLKRRGQYRLRGKEAIVDDPPERNPERDPEQGWEQGPGDARR